MIKILLIDLVIANSFFFFTSFAQTSYNPGIQLCSSFYSSVYPYSSCFLSPFKIEMPPKFISSKCSRTSLFWYLFSLLWQTLLKVLTKAATYFKRCTITPWNHCHQIEKGRRHCTIFYFLPYSWEYSKAC